MNLLHSRPCRCRRRTNDALMVERSLETSRQAISRLRREIDEVLTPLVPGKKCALLDFPHHPNVGDLTIRVGSDRNAGDRAAANIRKQGKLTLAVGDRKSVAFARVRFECSVVLRPNMAFRIGPIGAAAFLT